MSRRKPEAKSQHDEAWEHALVLTSKAQRSRAPSAWQEAREAWEVAADAAEECGWLKRAESNRRRAWECQRRKIGAMLGRFRGGQ